MRKGERDHTEKPNLLELLNEELEAIGEAIMLHLCRAKDRQSSLRHDAMPPRTRIRVSTLLKTGEVHF